MMKRKRQYGFTLIEILIVVAVVAILAAVAVPSYRDSIRKSCRNDGKAALLDIVALQEKRYFQNNAYAADISSLGYADVSAEGCYDLSMALSESCSSSGSGSGSSSSSSSGGGTTPVVNRCFTVTATARGDQVNDTSCRTFSINSIGRKVATDSSSADNTDRCW